MFEKADFGLKWTILAPHYTIPVPVIDKLIFNAKLQGLGNEPADFENTLNLVQHITQTLICKLQLNQLTKNFKELQTNQLAKYFERHA